MQSNTVKEMYATIDIIEKFDYERVDRILNFVEGKDVVISGMGSSYLFPANLARMRALQFGINNKIHKFLPNEILNIQNFEDYVFIFITNSGSTKETLNALKYVSSKGAKTIGITGKKDSMITKLVDLVIYQTGKFEKGVAATKSVIEQAIILDSLIHKLVGKEVDLSNILPIDKLELVLDRDYPDETLEILSKSELYYFVSDSFNVAGELALKSYEMIRKQAASFLSSQIVHGIEESIRPGVLFFVNSDTLYEYEDDIYQFAKRTKQNIVWIGQKKIDYEVDIHLDLEVNKFSKPYLDIISVWSIYKAMIEYMNIDVDNPVKIKKVGNMYTENIS